LIQKFQEIHRSQSVEHESDDKTSHALKSICFTTDGSLATTTTGAEITSIHHNIFYQSQPQHQVELQLQQQQQRHQEHPLSALPVSIIQHSSSSLELPGGIPSSQSSYDYNRNAYGKSYSGLADLYNSLTTNASTEIILQPQPQPAAALSSSAQGDFANPVSTHRQQSVVDSGGGDCGQRDAASDGASSEGKRDIGSSADENEAPVFNELIWDDDAATAVAAAGTGADTDDTSQQRIQRSNCMITPDVINHHVPSAPPAEDDISNASSSSSSISVVRPVAVTAGAPTYYSNAMIAAPTLPTSASTSASTSVVAVLSLTQTLMTSQWIMEGHRCACSYSMPLFSLSNHSLIHLPAYPNFPHYLLVF
jgi:hypothetical protein